MTKEIAKELDNTRFGKLDEKTNSSESELSDLLCVPKVELNKLEKSRVELYDFLKDKLSEQQMLQVVNITGQIWKVANTKKWD